LKDEGHPDLDGAFTPFFTSKTEAIFPPKDDFIKSFIQVFSHQLLVFAVSNFAGATPKKVTRWWLSNIFLDIFTPIPGEMIQFDLRMFFKCVGSTTN